MPIEKLLFSIIRKWWLIVTFAVLCGGIGYYLNVYLSYPIYRADATLYILNKDKVDAGEALSTQDLTVSQSLVKKYSGIFYSRTVTSTAAMKLIEYNISEDMITSMVSITSQEDSNLLNVRAVGPDPKVAAAVADAMGEEFTTVIRTLTKSDYIGVLDRAQVPVAPMPNNGAKKTFIWLLAGLIIAFSIIYIIEYFDTTVRSIEDIEDELKIRVIGLIPEHNIR